MMSQPPFPLKTVNMSVGVFLNICKWAFTLAWPELTHVAEQIQASFTLLTHSFKFEKK